MTDIVALDDFAKEQARVTPTFQSRFGAVWFHEIGRQKPRRDWLIKNLMLARTFGVMFGPPGCGKSFLCTDLCLAAAAQTAFPNRSDWFGYRARPFGVVYIVAEGHGDFEIRLHAWRAAHSVPTDTVLPFVFLPTSIDMRSSDADTTKLVEEITSLSEQMKQTCGVGVELVVIDTVARALAGGNENASDVMGAFVINCGKLLDATGAAVLGVHHGGKEGGRGPRGHEALHGAADFEIEVIGATPETPNMWAVRKLKAGPAGRQHKFRLRQRPVGDDADGDPITSCVVVGEHETQSLIKERPKGFKTRPIEREFLDVLAVAIDEAGVMPPAGLKVPPRVNLVVQAAQVRERFVARYSQTETGDEEAVSARLRARWSRATRGLLKYQVIGSSQPWLWFTGKPIQGFRLHGVSDAAPTHVEEPVDDLLGHNGSVPGHNDERPGHVDNRPGHDAAQNGHAGDGFAHD